MELRDICLHRPTPHTLNRTRLIHGSHSCQPLQGKRGTSVFQRDIEVLSVTLLSTYVRKSGTSKPGAGQLAGMGHKLIVNQNLISHIVPIGTIVP